ncbi:LysR substrate-binding domain-containing protein [Vibrio mexicanus]|uniref:LysR substrate-binding domain-containing protein n=1 Tax=Vibrio mexicanus TaxID=1004326 RepID=UPI00063C3A1D|nr:LysR substrate-binding domain-containing protein [Vibrio mexicanus]
MVLHSHKPLLSNKQQLLSLLHTFSVAAKHLSFTLAADELFLTQGGVSHRIKKLEGLLRFNLFIRKTRKLELTAEGKRVLVMLNSSFDSIFSELVDIQTGELSGELYIATSPYFASAWLMPRLASFRAQYPNLAVKLQTKQNQNDFQFDPYDVAIFYSSGQYPNHFSQRLFEGTRTPVCSPDYAKLLELDNNPESLAQANFIHSGDTSAWHFWLDQVGMKADCEQRSDLYSDNLLAVEAAIHSMGVALGRLEFVKPMIDSGSLVAPFPSISSGKGYDLVCPKGMETRTKFQVFNEWAMGQAAAN